MWSHPGSNLCSEKSNYWFQDPHNSSKLSKEKDKFLPSYVISSLFDIIVDAFDIMIQIITVIFLPYPTKYDNIFESGYRFLVMISSGVIIFNKRKYCV